MALATAVATVLLACVLNHGIDRFEGYAGERMGRKVGFREIVELVSHGNAVPLALSSIACRAIIACAAVAGFLGLAGFIVFAFSLEMQDASLVPVFMCIWRPAAFVLARLMPCALLAGWVGWCAVSYELLWCLDVSPADFAMVLFVPPIGMNLLVSELESGRASIDLDELGAVPTEQA